MRPPDGHAEGGRPNAKGRPVARTAHNAITNGSDVVAERALD